jgi:hypothetical protein
MKSIHTTTARLLIATALAMSTAVPILVSPAWATTRCPGLVVGVGRVAECKVVNYGNVADFNVTMRIYDGGGNERIQCGPFSVLSKGSRFCAFHSLTAVTDVHCEVTGEGPAARVSLYVLQDGETTSAGAVGCP